MTKKHSLKRALMFSTLSLLLCASMLVGTTYAWFTDSVSSTNNIIKSGNLDVALYYDNDTTTDWTEVKDTTNIFKENTLWEPGHTEVVKLKLSNLGTLALKYQFGINVAAEITSENVFGQPLKLSDYIYFGVIEGEQNYTRAEAVKAVENSAVKLNTAYTANETLMATESDIVTLVVYMPETVGNEANYRGTQPVINLGVNLYATQYTYENDTFGPEYDEDAVYADAKYTTDANTTLKDTLDKIDAAEDETVLIQLSDNVTWTTEGSHGSSPFVSANAKVKNLIIDGNGHTITADGAGVGSIRLANGGTLTIKNATIVDNTVSYKESAWEFTYLEFAGNLKFSNVTFEGGIALQAEDNEADLNATFTNCTFNTVEDSVYGVWVSDGVSTFKNCTFKGTRGLKAHEAYGSNVTSVTVDNCTFDNLSKKPGVAIGTLDSTTTFVIKNSDFINCQAGDQGKYIYESDTDVTTFNFKASENNEVIKSVTPDLEIGTKEELFAFANDVNVNGNGYAGKLIVLTANIDLNNEEWTPVGQTGGNGVATYFQGMFDGRGYTISNLKITDNAYDEGPNYAAGLFGFVDAGDAQIVNLNVDKADVNGHHWTGVIAGFLTGKISGCTVSNATVTCTHANGDACGDKAGAIVGYVNSGTVTNNTAKDCTVKAGRDAGQIAGTAKAEFVYDNTVYNVNVSANGDCTGANIRNEEIGRIN